MTVLVNGKPNQCVSALDRGMLYGHTVFETVGIVNGSPVLLAEHLDRLNKGCERLDLPISIPQIESELSTLIEHIEAKQNFVARITISMGEGGRGYLTPEDKRATRILSLHGYPAHSRHLAFEGVRLGLSDVKLGAQPMLAGIKHGNRLEQIIARSRWERDWNEALLCDQNGYVIEGTQSNVIIVKNRVAFTPIIDACGVEGVIKSWALLRLKELGVSCQSVRLSVQDVTEADEVFLTNSIIGVWPVKHFLEREYRVFSTAQQLMKLIQQHEIIPSN